MLSEHDNIVVDIWGGECHLDHVARFLKPLSEALQLAKFELASGFLVNLRRECAWGKDEEFDLRRRH